MACLTSPMLQRVDRPREKYFTSSNHSGHYNFTWKIKGFSMRTEYHVISDSFPDPGNYSFGWIVAIDPNGLLTRDEETDETYVGCFLQLVNDCKDTVFVRCVISLRNSDGRYLCPSRPFKSDLIGGKGIGNRRFVKRAELLAGLKNDELIVHVVMSFTFSNISRSEDGLVCYSHRADTASVLVDDFSELFYNNKLSDVVIQVGDKEIPAHKALLAARSKVFAAMFEYDTLENKTSRIEITDFQFTTVKLMLMFVYTNEMKRFDETLAPELMRIADKYDLDDMKTYFSNHFIASINLSNVIELAILADVCNAVRLKEEAVEFTVANKASVDFESQKSALKKCPEVMFQIVKLAVRKSLCKTS